MKLETLQDLYLEELKDVYDAEQQILKALPKMVKAVSHSELQGVLEDHIQTTEEQIDRLEQIFEALGTKAKGSKCEAMKGLIEEGKEMMDKDAVEDVMDAGLIVAAQKVEHYEIAAYGSLRTFAEMLGFDDQAELLQQTLDEESEMDERLTELAEEVVNVDAAEEEEEEEEDTEEKEKEVE